MQRFGGVRRDGEERNAIAKIKMETKILIYIFWIHPRNGQINRARNLKTPMRKSCARNRRAVAISIAFYNNRSLARDGAAVEYVVYCILPSLWAQRTKSGAHFHHPINCPFHIRRWEWGAHTWTTCKMTMGLCGMHHECTAHINMAGASRTHEYRIN